MYLGAVYNVIHVTDIALPSSFIAAFSICLLSLVVTTSISLIHSHRLAHARSGRYASSNVITMLFWQAVLLHMVLAISMYGVRVEFVDKFHIDDADRINESPVASLENIDAPTAFFFVWLLNQLGALETSVIVLCVGNTMQEVLSLSDRKFIAACVRRVPFLRFVVMIMGACVLLFFSNISSLFLLRADPYFYVAVSGCEIIMCVALGGRGSDTNTF